MLQVRNLYKNYKITSDNTVCALKGVTLNFRRSEFVSVLGPSGCGKTTLLNIIGGLDGFDGGDMLVGGVSVLSLGAREMDAYRNRSVGFVFQSYNLIPHLSILENVTLALSLQGVKKSERERRARAALKEVGLESQLKKKPNQLSGGQMQRVTIARAIVNSPDIILADEPTGALDSETGVQIVELLKKISAHRLVIMVTHNAELAQKYSSRIVHMLDGEVISDSDPYTDEQLAADSAAQEGGLLSGDAEISVGAGTVCRGVEGESGGRRKKVKMRFSTSLGISFKSLFKKKWRTFWTSFAGSIGIFGIAIVLAIGVGMGNYVDYMQTEVVGNSAITLGEKAYTLDHILSVLEDAGGANNTKYPDIDGVIPYQRESFATQSTLTDEFLEYIKNIDQSWIKAINYTYDVKMHVLQQNSSGGYSLLTSWGSYAHQMIEEDELIEENYSVLAKAEDSADGFPKDHSEGGWSEVSLVVDKYNRITPGTLSALGIPYKNADGSYKQVPFSDIVGREYSIVLNDGWYREQENGTYKVISSSDYKNIAPENMLKVKIASVLRVKNDRSTLWLESGLVYLPELSEFLVQNAKDSQVGQAQLASQNKNVVTGGEFTVRIPGTPEEEEAQIRTQYISALKDIGAYTVPVSIQLYPSDLGAKNSISAYIDSWNSAHKDQEVAYLDLTELALRTLSGFIDIVTYVLVAFSAVALVVSTVMISVTTYTSVVERTKEIGILRSMGARKLDIANVFNGETLIIGSAAGVMGVAFALGGGAIVNVILKKMVGLSTLVCFSWQIIVGMIALSVGLTLFAGLVPAIIAARKRPVECLRSE